MKAWEKHLVDLYLLANDVLENLYYQPHGYKARFFYAFNPELPLLQSDASYSAQLKLLKQLADKGAVEYEIKQPADTTPEESLSIRAKEALHTKLILLRIKPMAFNRLYDHLKQYRPVQQEPLLQKDRTVHLHKDDTKLVMRVAHEPNDYVLGVLRYDQVPYRLFDYLLNEQPGVVVSRTMLELAGIGTDRKLNEIAAKGLKPLARGQFMPIRKADSLKLTPKIVLPQSTVEAIIAEAAS